MLRVGRGKGNKRADMLPLLRQGCCHNAVANTVRHNPVAKAVSRLQRQGYGNSDAVSHMQGYGQSAQDRKNRGKCPCGY